MGWALAGRATLERCSDRGKTGPAVGRPPPAPATTAEPSGGQAASTVSMPPSRPVGCGEPREQRAPRLPLARRIDERTHALDPAPERDEEPGVLLRADEERGERRRVADGEVARVVGPEQACR